MSVPRLGIAGIGQSDCKALTGSRRLEPPVWLALQFVATGRRLSWLYESPQPLTLGTRRKPSTS